jgi:thioredoxin-related protein
MDTAVKFFTENSIDDAFELARTIQKPVLIDFWATNCKGCEKMDAVTYKDAAVQEYLEEHYVVVKCHTNKITHDLSKNFLTTALLWSPSFFVYAADGTIVRTIVGYLSPGQFITELSIGKAAFLMRKGKHADALTLLNNLTIASEYPVLDQETMYWEGVAAFYAKQKDFADIAPYWNKLKATYPGSTWAEKADILPKGI